MKIFQSAETIASDLVASDLAGSVVAIGNFDGIHKGHQELISVSKAKAKSLGAPVGVVTFEPHPQTFFRPQQPVFRLTPLELKAVILEEHSVDFVVAIPFDKNLSSMEAEKFVQSWLIDNLRVRHVVTGYDFHFGKGRTGDTALLKQMGEADGFGVTVVDQVSDDDDKAPFASSAVRKALRQGDLKLAHQQLGYHFTLWGKVVEGDKRGRTIGFPTANIALDAGVEIHEGIYATRVTLPDGTSLQGAGYIGYRPTFATDRQFLEIFLFDFDSDLYGKELKVEFISFIRPDKKFDTIDGLISQMNKRLRRNQKGSCKRLKLLLRSFRI